MNPAKLERTILEILSQPTAPFRESWVMRACQAYCTRNRIPFFEDSFGNVWVNAKSATAAKRAKLAFVAHTDHPGVVVQKFFKRGQKVFAEGTWLGGGPLDIRSHDVLIFSHVDACAVFNGKVVRHTVNGMRGPDKVTIEVQANQVFSWLGQTQLLGKRQTRSLLEALCSAKGFQTLGPWGACLWYKKQGVSAGVRKHQGFWQTKAADDLIGVCALLESIRHTRAKGCVLLLTRAEESGFHGALDVLTKKRLNPKMTRVVSIETSATLPGALLGKGPVVRLGDRSTVFSPAFVYWVQSKAAELAKKNKRFAYQRRVMDGGSCEATAFNCFGFEVAGLSTPLQNYHNIPWHKKGAARKKPQPEAVHTADVAALTELLIHLMQNSRELSKKAHTSKPFSKMEKSLIENFRQEVRHFWE